jgi:phage terminase Nu1 subunit (DNA packaging protein)
MEMSDHDGVIIRRPKRVRIGWSTGKSKERLAEKEQAEEQEEEEAELAAELARAHAALAEAQAQLMRVQLKVSRAVRCAGGGVIFQM